MINEKLSELSKPVQIFKHPSGRNFWSVSADSNAGHQGVEPFYSQEYVSALLARIANLEFEQGGYGYSVLEDLNGKIKRIAELEEQLATWASRAEALGAKLDAAEKRLATPVRLPSFDCYKPDVARELQEGFKNTVRADGFTVEGDE